jgi:hypothetical protein
VTAAVEHRIAALPLWHFSVRVDSQAVHLISFRITNIADRDMSTPVIRCSQLSASRRQFVHLTCRKRKTVPQFEHDQIIVGIDKSLLSS